MRITEIKAENFLSFGSGDDSFHLDLAPDMTVIVGPNASGKTNVLRVVERVLDSLDATAPADIASDYHRPDGAGRAMVLAIRVVFDEVEQALLTALMKLALAYPGDNPFAGFTMVDGGDGKQRGNDAKEHRLNAYRQWVGAAFTPEHFAPLFDGYIKLLYDPEERNRTLLRFESASLAADAPVMVEISGRNVLEGRIGLNRRQESMGNGSMARKYLNTLRPSIQEELGRYLHGEEVKFPALPAPDLRELAGTAPAEWMSTNLADAALQSPDPLVKAFLVAAQDLGLSMDRWDLAKGIRALVGRSVAILTQWAPELEAPLLDGQVFEMWGMLTEVLTQALQTRQAVHWPVPSASERAKDFAGGRHLVEPWLTTPFTLLRVGKLALYLVRLRLGTQDQKRMYERITGTFRGFAGVDLDMRISAHQAGSVAGQPVNAVVKVALETNDGMRLRDAGSGVPQALYLSAVTNAFAGTVLFLDEPEIHLHPNIKRRLPGLLAQASGAQHVTIAHSPYSVPTPWHSTVRRVSRMKGRSRASGSLPAEALNDDDLALARRGQGIEDKAFLFSAACVFVEGPNDAAAYQSWFDAWALRKEKGQNYSTRLGVVFQVAGGTARTAEMVLVAEVFDVPAVGLLDTDVLRQCDEATEKGRAQNKAALGLIDKWTRLKLIQPGIRLQDPASLRQMQSGRLRVLQPAKDAAIDWKMNMEALFSAKMKAVAVADGRGAPSAYGLIASTWTPEEYAPYLERAFADVEQLAIGQS